MPETLQALIAARLDGLQPAERRIVQDAAVLGKTFAREALAEISERTVDELEPVLASLLRKEVLTVQADPRSPERGQYGFLGDLMRFVAYETLGRRERKTRHLSVARYLQSATDEIETVELVASHYLQAYNADPDAADAAAIREQALAALRNAGDRAASLGAHQEAIRYYRQAIDLLEPGPESAALLVQAGRSANSAGDPHRSAALLEEAQALFEAAGDAKGAARASARHAEVVFQLRGIEQEATDRMEEAFRVLTADDAEPNADVALLGAELARRMVFSGRNAEAHDYVEFALTAAELLDLPEVFSQALNTKAMILGIGGRPSEAGLLLRRALEVALEHGFGAAALRSSNNLVTMEGLRSNYREQLDVSASGLAIGQRLGDRFWEGKLLAGRILPLTELGRWDEALQTMVEVDAMGDAARTVAVLTEVTPAVLIHGARGDLTAARDMLHRWDPLPDDLDPYDAVSRTLVAARVAQAEGDAAGALALGCEAWALNTEFGASDPSPGEGFQIAVESAFELDRPDLVQTLLGEFDGTVTSRRPVLHAEALRFRGRLDAAAGDHRSAERRYVEACERLRELGTPFRLAVALTELTGIVGARRGPDGAAMLADEAREIFTGLRARAWLARVEQAASRPAVA